ncbi:TonB-dependent receptor [Lysobacter sp. LF1]|uniref:TonB-dependent receptor n=1 Tax=Lysobacter stagni TaxID=3045172 RepID=A0ABT6XD01_9GAMM|nr:TonB-dependent receptor [Lysobacter sp. LF1]MDI9238003.1 TonB-dependent receptor [Lysobacter sp. LF1]
MKLRKTMLSASIVAALGFAGSAVAQETATVAQSSAAAQDAKDLDTVVVVGIRASQEKSLDTKRNAGSHIEVVTAEDVGKLPAHNVADTLQRLPGVSTSSSSANEGGFDENDRISLRGTSPSLTQTLVNGHTIGSADWFILSQVETVGRSVSYSLLPSEIVSQAVVHKTSEAKFVEGGSAGSVNVITRKPLEFANQISAEGSIGAVYSDLPGTTKPQLSGLFNYKNDANTFGFMAQAFYQERELRRDGQEIVGGFSTISATDPVAATNPDLIGVKYPSLPGSVYFTQTRERMGGLIELQAKPSDDLTLGLSAFYSDMDAANYNRNYMLWTGNFVPNQAPLPGYVVQNGVLVKADYAAAPSAPGYGIYDMISRPESAAKTGYVTFDAAWDISDKVSMKGQVGTTKGTGSTPTQNIAEVVTGRSGGGWQVRGTDNTVNWYLNNPSGPTTDGFGTWGIQYYDVIDKEDWMTGDFTWFGNGTLSSVDFGARYADHTREVNSPFGSDPGDIAGALAGAPVGSYPGDFGTGLGGSFPTNVWYFTQGALENAVNNNSTVRKDGARHNYGSEFNINEENLALYVQGNFEGDNWTANAGLRYVDIDQDIKYYRGLAGTAVTPDVSSLFGDFQRVRDQNSHSKVLPSANFRYNINEDLVLRLAASQTMTMPDYSALAGAVSLSNLTHTGTSGNSDLDPIVSTNFDASLEWYFVERGLLSLSLFSMDLDNYVKYGTETRAYVNDQNGMIENYEVTLPINSDGKVRGAEVSYEQPFGDYFGVQANYTYTDAEADGGDPLVGASKNTWNLSAYFENDQFNARIGYTFRSSFYHGMLRANQYFQDDFGTLSASVGWKATDWMSITLDALNLNDPTLNYFVADGAPQAFYNNGRQYYLNFRFKY